jgi:hypothetical protein
MSDHGRVYFKRSRVAHLMPPGYLMGGSTLCGLQAWWKGTYGTGSQDEYERAASLPLCQHCADKGGSQ